jgi:hypothetical protein
MRNVASEVCRKVSYFVHNKPHIQLLKQMYNIGDVRTNTQLWFQLKNNLKFKV